MRQVLGAGALERPRGMGWGGRREGGSGWWTHINPWLIHVNVWQKPLQNCKAISLQLIKINGGKKRLWFFQWSYMDVRVGLCRKLRAEKLMLLNCGVGLESPLDCKEIQPVHPKGDQSWVFIGRTDAEAETPILWPPHAKTHWKRPWWWEGLGAGGEGDDRGWDGWIASPTLWIWVWVNSGSWWWTGRPGVLRFMGSERVGHDWATELNETRLSDWDVSLWCD